MDGRKPLGEYVREGAMIFVAVTLGFLADNYRDYRGEREAERSYMRALVDDLTVDSARLTENIMRLRGNIANADTMVHEFIAGRATGRYAPSIATHGRYAGNSVDLVFNDRTSSVFNLATVMFLPKLETEVALGTEIRGMIRSAYP